MNAERALALAESVPLRSATLAAQLQALTALGLRLLVEAETRNKLGQPVSESTTSNLRHLTTYLSRARPSDLAVTVPQPENGLIDPMDQELSQLAGALETLETLPATTTTHGPVGGRTQVLRLPLPRPSLAYAFRLAVATSLSGCIALSIGLDHWYWTPVCAVATVFGSDTFVTWQRAAQRAIGTVAGCLVGATILLFEPSLTAGVTIIGVLLFTGELLFPRNHGFAMTPITAMIVIIIALASPVPVGTLLR